MTGNGPSVDQILAEWIVEDLTGDLTRWREGMRRYDAASLDDQAEVAEAAELMCAALTHYVAGAPLTLDPADGPPELVLPQTIWNVLVATLFGDEDNALSVHSNRRLRLALAAARQGGYQPEDLGGDGLMNEVFDRAGSRARMTAALSATPAGPDAPAGPQTPTAPQTAADPDTPAGPEAPTGPEVRVSLAAWFADGLSPALAADQPKVTGQADGRRRPAS